VLLAGCGFQSAASGNASDSNAPPRADAALDAGAILDSGNLAQGDAFGDAHPCFGTLVPICLSAIPAKPISVTAATSLDTSQQNTCTEVIAQPTGPDLCVIAGAAITISGPVTVTGSRPLALVSTDTITLSAAGTLDVSSTVGTTPHRSGAGANPVACGTAGLGTSDAGGAGGGAGGSFGTRGGNGGTGDRNSNGDPPGAAPGGTSVVPAAAKVLRGGCPGGSGGAGDSFADHRGGAGGDGGGAVYLFASRFITIDGAVFASGAGGQSVPNASGSEQGGGGGGSGGMITLEAPIVAVAGVLVANGGAGGGGGARSTGGTPGADGTTASWATRAAAGIGGVDPGGGVGGNGAAGSSVSPLDILDGHSSDGGGGGGAGGAGVIWISGVLSGGTKVSPAVTPAPR